MMALEVTPLSIPIVFLAGAASFLSPCVLPLVPGYLSYVSGISSGAQARTSTRLVVATTAFVGGFTTVFVALGLSASLLGSFLVDNRTLLTRVAGVLIIVMGLAFLGLIPAPWLYSERRFRARPAQTAPGSYLMGLAFGFGWTPCIGPALAATLAIASTEQRPGRGALLLLVYSLGLGLPFLISAVGASRVTGALAFLRRRQQIITKASGVLLIAVGLLFAFNRLFLVSIWLQRAMAAAGLDFWTNL